MGRIALARALNSRKGGDDRYKWAQVLLSPDVHTRLKHMALDEGVTLKELLENIVTNFITKEDNHGGGHAKRSNKET